MNNIFNNEANINEKFYKLKYHYLIDPNALIYILKESEEYKAFIESSSPDANTISSLFKKIYDETFKYAHIYTGLLTDLEEYNFFGSPKNYIFAREMKNYLKKINSSLLKHCIMYGFLYETDINNEYKISTLSAKYHNYNLRGYYSSDNKDNISNNYISLYDASPQKYNSIYKRLLEHKSEFYSTHILNNICVSLTNDKFYNVLDYRKNIALYILDDKACSNFSKILINSTRSTTILNAYSELFKSCKNTSSNYNTLDKFIFQSYMEYLFGFSTARNICNILDNCTNNNEPIFKQEGLVSINDIYNDILLNDLHLVLDCPAIYARNYLLEYVLFSLCNTQNYEKKYLNPNKRYYYYSTMNPSQNKSINIETANTRFRDFFNTINNITIPVLEDLWIIVTYSLFNNTKSSLLDTYKIYISDLNDNFYNFDIDYYSFLPKTRKSLSHIINNTFTNKRFNYYNSLPMWPNNMNIEKNNTYILNNALLKTNFFTS